MSPLTLGFMRGIGFAVIMAAVTYLGDASHLTGITTPYIAAIISSLALALENHMASKGDKALFGAVTQK